MISRVIGTGPVLATSRSALARVFVPVSLIVWLPDFIATLSVCRRTQLPSAPWARRPLAGAPSIAINDKASAAKVLRKGTPGSRMTAVSAATRAPKK